MKWFAIALVCLPFMTGTAAAAPDKPAPNWTPVPAHGGDPARIAAEMPDVTPGSVEETINATLRHHHSLRAIQENREAVYHEVTRAKAGYGPRIDATGAAGWGWLSDSTTRGMGLDTGLYGASRVGVTLTQPIWDGLATRGRVRSAEATLDSMNHRVFDNATTLGLDGIIAHIDVLRRREIYALAQTNVTRHEEILAQVSDRASFGADTAADVSQAESRLARAQSSLVEARASLLEGEDTFYRLTGLLPIDALAPVPLPSNLPTSPEDVFERAKQNNPKLLAYLADIRTAKGEQEVVNSAASPIVNLEAGPSYTDRGGADDRWTYQFDILGTVRWNIFNSGADAAANRAAHARIRQARQTMYSFVDDMKLDIDHSWTQYLSAQEQFKHYSDAVNFNTVTRDAYQEQFILGERSLLDVLDAENELYNSSTQAATAQGNVLVGAYRLLALAGDLLPDMNIDTEFLDYAPVPLKREKLDSREEFNPPRQHEEDFLNKRPPWWIKRSAN